MTGRRSDDTGAAGGRKGDGPAPDGDGPAPDGDGTGAGGDGDDDRPVRVGADVPDGPPVRTDGGTDRGADGPRRRDGGAGTGADSTDADGGRRPAVLRDPRLVIARRELASLRSEKTILLALAIQLFVAAFSSFLVVGLVSLYDPGANQDRPVETAVAGNASDAVLEVLDEENGFRSRLVDGPQAAARAFETNSVDAAVVANRTPAGKLRVRVVAPRESVRTTLVVVRFRAAFEELERQLRLESARLGRLDTRPLPVPERVPSTPYFSFSYTVLVPLLMFLPAFISGSVAVDSLTEELQRGTLELLRVAPVSLPAIVDAKLLATATLAPAQAALWLGLLSVQGTTIARPVALVAMVAGVALVVVAAGVGVALLAPDRRQAQFVYSSGVIVVGAASLTLPEHPANTVAKLAVGSATPTTWVAVAGYLLLGALAYAAVRVAVRRTDPEGL